MLHSCKCSLQSGWILRSSHALSICKVSQVPCKLSPLLHGVCTLRTSNSSQPEVVGHLDVAATFIGDATSAFAEALEPHELPTEHHDDKARRLRLVLTSLSLLFNAEKSYMLNGVHFPGHTTESGLASTTSAWIVLPDSQHTGTWKLLHNCSAEKQATGLAWVAQIESISACPWESTCKKMQDYVLVCVVWGLFVLVWFAFCSSAT